MKRTIIALLLVTLVVAAKAEVTLPALFGNDMVLQQCATVTFRGTARPKAEVRIAPSWGDQQYVTKADADGAWQLSLSTPEAGGPYEIVFTDGTSPLTLNNVLLGEVWLCSGQSNMEMTMSGFRNQPVRGANMDALRSTNSSLRLFTVKRNHATSPLTEVSGSWAEATPETVMRFSATAYYFGRLLQEALGVPVGLVTASWSGSNCETWMSREMLADYPHYLAQIPEPGTKYNTPNRTPTMLFNGMISPLVGLAIKGVIWYQGEQNYDRAAEYADLFPTLIRGWREAWGQGDFPFYYCQIAPYDYETYYAKPGEELINAAFLREAQAKAEFKVENAGMAVLLDAGLREGIHPDDKRTAGERLALLAISRTYDIKGVSGDAPYVSDITFSGDTATVTFERSPIPFLCTKANYRSELFTLAGEDRVFHPAKAVVQTNKVIVTSPEVPHPVAVRYAFESYVEGDLFGGNGIPVSSFRSDDWEEQRTRKGEQ